jgi:hypothetical protein
MTTESMTTQTMTTETMTTTYFTAGSSEEVGAAFESAPVGAEVLTTAVAPHGDAFKALLQLIAGPEDVVSAATRSLVRLSPSLVADIANRDAAEFAELAGPWQRSGALPEGYDFDVAAYLADLQHLCRNAVAADRAVYAVESR